MSNDLCSRKNNTSNQHYSGYMAPEYAMEGHLSEKSDVFSLGVLLIEIVSGKKINKFSYQESLGLLGYVS